MVNEQTATTDDNRWRRYTRRRSDRLHHPELVGVIEWSWWLVFIPLYISIGFIVLSLIVGLLIINLMK